MESRRRLVYGSEDWKGKKKHGFGVDFLLGGSIVRIEMNVDTGRIGLDYYNWDDERRLQASWRVKGAKDTKVRCVLGGIGVILGELTGFDGSPTDLFHRLKRKMKNLLDEE